MHPQQETLVAEMSSLIQKGVSAHAYLLTGSRGVGKRNIVEAIIQNVISGISDSVSDDTQYPFSFKTPHPDVLVIERAQDATGIVLEDIQQAHQRLLHHPVFVPWNIVALFDVQQMNTQAGNAFLKLLEEPPPSALIFLTATTTSSLLPTIVSRCHRIKIPTVPHDALAEYLREKGAEPSRASWIAALSQGRSAFAETLLDESVWEETLSLIRNILPIISSDLPAGFHAIEAYSKEKEAYQRACGILLSLLRDLIMLKISPSLPLVNEWLSSELALLKDRFSLDRLTGCMSALLKEQEYLSIALHRRLRLEDVFLLFHHPVSV
ncbi:MAG: polymerase III, delta prime subunit protein [Parcubacteria group bacterium GW2011_GWA2_43_13]|nr:MAG: polymerase III, delta prime subunit protein [Parcubacteria group bacterium GW2011_GWA2_43_13]OGY71205.1 MAG: hypothetical protein A2986_00045 [Candidatus Jacksonbacteria bacterium RIFCSPLOWO2_01_FULL_44_13]HAZ16818.1 hypothetical protein [Candidatus Jacksonbacteria bacterium]